MQLVHGLAACGLVQPVDVLGDHRFQFALALQLCQPQVGGVGLCALHDELIAVKAVELLRVFLPEGVAQDRFRGVGVLLVVKPVHTAEVRDAALGGDARPAKEHDAAAFCKDVFQCLYHKQNRPFRCACVCVKIIPV